MTRLTQTSFESLSSYDIYDKDLRLFSFCFPKVLFFYIFIQLEFVQIYNVRAKLTF